MCLQPVSVTLQAALETVCPGALPGASKCQPFSGVLPHPFCAPLPCSTLHMSLSSMLNTTHIGHAAVTLSHRIRQHLHIALTQCVVQDLHLLLYFLHPPRNLLLYLRSTKQGELSSPSCKAACNRTAGHRCNSLCTVMHVMYSSFCTATPA